MSTRDILASVIRGESADPTGQMAVAGVMQNRLASGNFGANIANVVTPTNFNGWATPTPSSYAAADALLNGTLSPNPAGDALYFVAPARDLDSWGRGLLASGNGTNIGGNYFFANDQGAPITPGPVYAGDTGIWSGSVPQGPTPDNINPIPLGQGAAPYNTPGWASSPSNPAAPDQGAVSPDLSPSTDLGTPSGTTGFGQAGAGVSGGDLISSQPQGQWQLPGPLQSILGTNNPAASVTSGNASVAGVWEQVGAQATSLGDTAIAKSTAAAGEAEAKAIQEAAATTSKTQQATTAATNQTNASDTALLTGTATNISSSYLSNFKDLFVRGWLGFFGIVLLAGAVFFFMKGKENGFAIAE